MLKMDDLIDCIQRTLALCKDDRDRAVVAQLCVELHTRMAWMNVDAMERGKFINATVGSAPGFATLERLPPPRVEAAPPSFAHTLAEVRKVRPTLESFVDDGVGFPTIPGTELSAMTDLCREAADICQMMSDFLDIQIDDVNNAREVAEEFVNYIGDINCIDATEDAEDPQ
jgi:hypothetical protein